MKPEDCFRFTRIKKGERVSHLKKQKKKERQEYKRITERMEWQDTSDGFICNVDVLEEHYRFVSQIVKELDIYLVGRRAFVPCEPVKRDKPVVLLARAADCAVYTFYDTTWKQNVAFRLPRDRMVNLDNKINEYCNQISQ
jgi:hypothetical protein